MASTEDNNLREGSRASCNNLARRIVRLPVSIMEGISRTLSNAAPRRNPPTSPQPHQQQQDGFLIISEYLLFLTLFERQFGEPHPFFYACRFTEALKIAKDESKFVFLHLHSPENPFVAPFCRDTLCSQLVTEFLDANFVSWGAIASRGEGLEMASALQANTFPLLCCCCSGLWKSHCCPVKPRSISVVSNDTSLINYAQTVELLDLFL